MPELYNKLIQHELNAYSRSIKHLPLIKPITSIDWINVPCFHNNIWQFHWLPKKFHVKVGGVGVLFLRWWPPSTTWASPLIVVSDTSVWIIPAFRIWRLYATCLAHFMCHHELWPTSASPFSLALALAGGKHYQKIAIPILTCSSTFCFFNQLSLYYFLSLSCFLMCVVVPSTVEY